MRAILTFLVFTAALSPLYANAASVEENRYLTRLFNAALQSDNRALGKLLSSKAKLKWISLEDKSLVLSTLIERQNLKGISIAVHAGIDLNQPIVGDREGEPVSIMPLTQAITLSGDSTTALHLISAGADVNRGSIDDEAPLLMAAAYRAHEVVERLLARGADPNVQEKLIGATPLMIVLYKESDHVKALKTAHRLVEYGAQINAITSTGYTTLMFAAKSKNKAAMEWLLAKGVDANKVSDDNETAETLLAKKQPEGLAELLETFDRLEATAKPRRPQ